jgi:hypothetical protein
MLCKAKAYREGSPVITDRLESVRRGCASAGEQATYYPFGDQHQSGPPRRVQLHIAHGRPQVVLLHRPGVIRVVRIIAVRQGAHKSSVNFQLRK